MSIASLSTNWLTMQLAEQHAEQVWLRDLQLQQAQEFMARGLPTRKEEAWKYTDVSFLAKKAYEKAKSSTHQLIETIRAQRIANCESILIVLVNGIFSKELSDLRLLPINVVLSSLKDAFVSHSAEIQTTVSIDTNIARFPFAGLNAALMTDGIFLSIPKNTIIAAPLHVLYLNANQDDFVTSPRNIILAGETSQAVILEEHISQNAQNYFMNIVTDLRLEKNSNLQYYKIQNENLQSTHIAQTVVQQKQDSVLKMCGLAIGARLARDDIFVKLNERGAFVEANGFYALHQNDQHIDNHIQIDHVAAHGTSEMLYKGILDKKSHAVFNGKIFVHPNAQKTQSHQANHNLLLSADAAIDTKPELEIYADDVKCAHGDTVGQLDMDALFYLRARGIDKQSALQLLTHAFADDVLNRISHREISYKMLAILEGVIANEN